MSIQLQVMISSGHVSLSVRNRFRTIEAETNDYIIGSVDLQDYPEQFDTHVYIHRDGWFMAYYLAADPAVQKQWSQVG